MSGRLNRIRSTSEIKASIIVIIAWFLSTVTIFSQMIDRTITLYPGGSHPNGTSIVLPKVRLNQTFNFTVPLLVSPPYSASITFHEGSCGDITDNHTITNTDGSVTFTVTSRCPVGEDSFFNFKFSITKSGYIPDNQDFIVPIIRDTAKIVLTLDISGSMQLQVQGGTGTRIDALKTAVNMMVPKLEEFYQAGDSLGITYFSSVLYQPNTTDFPKNFISTEICATKVASDILYRNPMQMTGMGNGLLNAKAKLILDKDKAPNTTKIVFLFTDGLQNWGPLVKSNGNTLTAVSDKLNDLTTLKDSIRYYTIATWQAGLAPEILDSIAETGHGVALHVTSTPPLEN